MTKKDVFSELAKKLMFFLAFSSLSIPSFSATSVFCVTTDAEEGVLFTVQKDNTSVKEILNYVESHSNYLFIYSENVQSTLRKRVSINVQNKKVNDILKELSQMTGFQYKKSGRQIIISLPSKSQTPQTPQVTVNPKSAQRTVAGRIVDAMTKEPLVGASVMVKGSNDGAITDVNGDFSFKTDGTAPMLVVSYIGYKQMQVKAGMSSTLHLSMTPDNKMLDEVVVVGYGTQKKVNLTGSVASVDMTKISETRPITNVSSGLAGLVPGLYVRSSDNIPGSDASLLVRGQGTLNDSSPLVIIDGVEGSFNSITPNDIATISVLKDAASSAIYGSRAANGVILITTKRGQSGKIKLEYNGYVSGESVAHKMHFVSSNADYMELQNELLKNSGQSSMFSQANIDAWRTHDGENSLEWPSTDWANAVFRTSWTSNHNISLSGGTDAMSTFLSFNYQDTPGIIENTGYKKYSLRANNELRVNPWLKLGANLSASYTTRDPGALQVDDFFSFTSNCVPSIVIQGPDGKWGGTNNSEENQGGCLSPLSYVYKFTGNNDARDFNSKLFLTLTPLKGLVVNASYHYKFYDQKIKQIPHDLVGWNFQTNQVTIDWADTPRVKDSDTRSTRNFMDVDASYERRFLDNQLYFKVMSGASQEQYKSEYFNAMKTNLIDENLDQLNACTGAAEAYGNVDSNWAMHSFFGRVNLSWADRYLLEFNYRRDGSSRFSKGNRWGNFPSVSAGWIISDEPFMAPLKNAWLDNLKLRASYGSLGNNSVGDFATVATMSDALYVLNGKPVDGFVNDGIANGKLKWESTYVTNIGLDFLLFGKLNGSIDYYNKLTKNILARLPIPVEVGLVDPPVQNSARVRNRGIEVSLGWQDHIRDLNYFIRGNFTYNKNKVVRFKNGERSISGNTMIQEGYGINTLFVRKFDRIIQSDEDLTVVQNIIKNAPAGKNPFPNGTPVKGDILYKDCNNDGLINDDDRVPVGYGQTPRCMYGLTLGANWRGFDFSCQIDGVSGIKSYFNNNFYTTAIGQPQVINKRIADGRWYEGRTSGASFPRLTSANIYRNTLASDFWVENCAFVKIRNIQVGYTIPAAITQRIGVSRLRLYTSLENYFTFTSYHGLDPEVSGMYYPQMKQAVFGINLAF